MNLSNPNSTPITTTTATAAAATTKSLIVKQGTKIFQQSRHSKAQDINQ